MRTNQQQLFDNPPKPRKPARVMMHVIDAGDCAGPIDGGEHAVRFACKKCGFKTEWARAPNVTASKRGAPCPRCNGGDAWPVAYTHAIGDAVDRTAVWWSQQLEAFARACGVDESNAFHAEVRTFTHNPERVEIWLHGCYRGQAEMCLSHNGDAWVWEFTHSLAEEPPPSFDGQTFDAALDGERLGTALARVYAFLIQNPGWHTLSEIAAAAKCSESGASARLRDLRKPKFQLDYPCRGIESERKAGGLWSYRIIPEKDNA